MPPYAPTPATLPASTAPGDSATRWQRRPPAHPNEHAVCLGHAGWVVSERSAILCRQRNLTKCTNRTLSDRLPVPDIFFGSRSHPTLAGSTLDGRYTSGEPGRQHHVARAHAAGPGTHQSACAWTLGGSTRLEFAVRRRGCIQTYHGAYAQTPGASRRS